MPLVQPGAKVLVTGANGFLAMWAVQRLLDRGYSVRGTVRSASKGGYVKEYFQSYGNRFELAIVPDIAEEGAFDESLAGVDGVLHMASPLPHVSFEDPKDFIRPAIGGTLGILKSALNVPNIKRIVFTSSVATIMEDASELTILSEKDWNEQDVKLTEEQGFKTTSVVKYSASKVLAEKGAWEFYEQHKHASPYDFVVINPPWIYGPAIHEAKTPSSLGTSAGRWYNVVVGNPDVPRSDETLTEVLSWVDVRDVVDAHITALEKEEVSGERIIVSAGSASWQQWIDVANEVQSSIHLARPLPRGKPGIPPKELIRFDTSKETHLLGTKYRNMHKVAKDSLTSISKKGW